MLSKIAPELTCVYRSKRWCPTKDDKSHSLLTPGLWDFYPIFNTLQDAINNLGKKPDWVAEREAKVK